MRPLVLLVSSVAISACVALEKIAGEKKGVFHQAERSQNGMLVLTANNGFFDKGKVRATGKGMVEGEEKALISASFQALEFISGKDAATARWYLFAEAKTEGTVTIEFAQGKGEGSWSLEVGKNRREFLVGKKEKLRTFPISFRKGKQQISLRKSGNGMGIVKSVRLKGAEMKKLSLLRARWRPAAIHTRYWSEGCPEPVMWIFESRTTSSGSSYSPMTTKFGYFGASFGANRRAAGGVNFSMWALSQKGAKGKLPALEQMPHLLATGNPGAEFSGFGHEGSGVKIRNWTPYAHQPESVIQALRVEKNGIYHTYYGYLFDEAKNQWVLYAAGNKVPRRNTKAILRASSFCEVPGPPQVERTGDVERVLDRRGWFVDAAGQIFPVDRMTTKARFQNHGIAISKDHWFRMTTGGVDFREVSAEVKSGYQHKGLIYLKPDVLEGLYQLPAEIGGSHVTEIESGSATISYQLKSPGRAAKGVVWYGEVDGITFAPRKFHGTERGRASEKLFGKGRVWDASTDARDLAMGDNRFRLNNLKPDTKYFYRILVENQEGKCWAAQSGSFKAR
ncbi:fibronectin type III domain-containing protein [Akkermansiaceae bacterium]|nr:fibronectin type III domain-containing protein [Akkermansiaceae bacterium]